MKHARPDYDRIQDPAGLIPMDEPVFLLRAKDKAAPFAVIAWADKAERAGADPAMAGAARIQAAAMFKWQTQHGSQIPNMPAPGRVVDLHFDITDGTTGERTGEQPQPECIALWSNWSQPARGIRIEAQGGLATDAKVLLPNGMPLEGVTRATLVIEGGEMNKLTLEMYGATVLAEALYANAVLDIEDDLNELDDIECTQASHTAAIERIRSHIDYAKRKMLREVSQIIKVGRGEGRGVEEISVVPDPFLDGPGARRRPAFLHRRQGQPRQFGHEEEISVVPDPFLEGPGESFYFRAQGMPDFGRAYRDSHEDSYIVEARRVDTKQMRGVGEAADLQEAAELAYSVYMGLAQQPGH